MQADLFPQDEPPKICNACRRQLPASAFTWSSRRYVGKPVWRYRRSECRECSRLRNKVERLYGSARGFANSLESSGKAGKTRAAGQ